MPKPTTGDKSAAELLIGMCDYALSGEGHRYATVAVQSRDTYAIAKALRVLVKRLYRMRHGRRGPYMLGLLDAALDSAQGMDKGVAR